MSPFLGKKKFQRFFEKLHLLSLYGMNYGRSGEIESSGEEQVFGLIKKQFAGVANGVFLDCGANIGEYAQGLAANIPEGATIYAFEPGKTPYAKMVENTKHNRNIITCINFEFVISFVGLGVFGIPANRTEIDRWQKAKRSFPPSRSGRRKSWSATWGRFSWMPWQIPRRSRSCSTQTASCGRSDWAKGCVA